MVEIALPDDNQVYAQVLADGGGSLMDVGVGEITELYKAHGALLFRGFDFDFDVFSAFSAQFCSGFVFNNSGLREVADSDKQIQTVNLGWRKLPLHPELAREPYRPDVCFFACVTPAAQGGETVICDGVEVVRNMDRELVADLRERRLRYERQAGREEVVYWLKSAKPTRKDLDEPPEDCPYAFRQDGGRVMCSFTRPALYKPMFTDDLAWGNFLLFARTIGNRIDYPMFDDGSLISDEMVERIRQITDDVTHPVNWQPNDLLMLDNTRFMHGRNEIGDPENRKIFTQFGYLNFARDNPEEGKNPRWRGPEGLTGLFAEAS